MEEPRRLAGQGATKADPILVLAIEDNRLLRDAIVAILDREPDLAVAAVAEDAQTALQRLPEAKPHVVLVDASLGDDDAHHLVEQIGQSAPEARVVVMDLLAAAEDVLEFIRRGASGFVLKDATVDDLVQTIRSVAEGKQVLPAVATGTLFSQIAGQADGWDSRNTARDIQITRREREIIDLIAEGLSNKEIATRIHLSPHTVKSHVHNILEKLDLHSRLQLAAHVHSVERPTEGPPPPPDQEPFPPRA